MAMTSDDILTRAIATTLSGNRKRVLELFRDEALYERLAAAPDAGGTLHFSPQAHDGWYLTKRAWGYEVYFQERGLISGSLFYPELEDAAERLFRKVDFAPALRKAPATEVESKSKERWNVLVPWDTYAPDDSFTGSGEPAAFDMCTGFLQAMGYLNDAEANCYTDFFLRPLPPAADLHSALTLHFQHVDRENLVLSDAQRLERVWRIDSHAVALPKAFIASVCMDWFFESQHMGEMPRGDYRLGLVATFIDMLERAIGACDVREVTIDPPGWYAIRWDMIAFERGQDRFLLHFSHTN